MRGAGFVCSILILLMFVSPVWAMEWQNYVNARFGTKADIPAHFVADPPPSNGDGRSFRDPNRVGEIAVYASYNVLSDSLSGYRDYLIDSYRKEGWELTYMPQGDQWFVLSGIRAEDILYLRVEHGAGCGAELLHHMMFTYPQGDKLHWDPIVNQGAKSLDGPCG